MSSHKPTVTIPDAAWRRMVALARQVVDDTPGQTTYRAVCAEELAQIVLRETLPMALARMAQEVGR